MKIILASASPRRKEILENVGFRFSVRPVDIDEASDASSPDKAVLDIARHKAYAAAGGAGELVIAADTVVAVDGAIIGKPRSREDAANILRRLSGRRHEVYTGVVFVVENEREEFCEKTDVYFKELSEEMIWDYISTGEPFDKAGAYGIQGFGSLLVSKIDGDYFNVMGLPIARLYETLRTKFGFKGMKTDDWIFQE